MAQKKEGTEKKPGVKIQDLSPKKDAKGGASRNLNAGQNLNRGQSAEGGSQNLEGGQNLDRGTQNLE